MSKKAKQKQQDGSIVCSVGGEALMEGIMMRGPHGYCQVVRNPAGEMVIETKRVSCVADENKFLGLPLVRGTVRLLDSMIVGMKALFHSAEISATEDDPAYQPSKFDLFIERKLGDKAMNVIMGISLVLALLLSVSLFFLLPNFLADLIVPKSYSVVFYNLTEGVVRLAIFLGYMIAISKMKDIRRVFMYHGAEHKTIHCYEHQDELTVENVRKYSKHHPRCGTAFLFVVMIISILVFSLVHRFSNIFLNLGVRLLLLPVVAGIAYEFNRFAGKNQSRITEILRAPGLAVQHFTTVEPEDDMIEVAIVALKEALALENAPNYSAAPEEPKEEPAQEIPATAVPEEEKGKEEIPPTEETPPETELVKTETASQPCFHE